MLIPRKNDLSLELIKAVLEAFLISELRELTSWALESEMKISLHLS